MSSSDDDMPLIKAKSADKIDKSVDKSMDRNGKTNGHVAPGISLAMGPMEDVQTHKPAQATMNGDNSKRKASMNGKTYKDASDSDDDKPLTKRRKTSAVVSSPDSDDSDAPLAQKTKRPPRASFQQIGQESDSDVPIAQKLQKQKAAIEAKAEKQAKTIRANDKKAKQSVDSDSDDVPLMKAKAAPARKSNGVKKEESESDDAPLSKKAPAVKTARAAKPVKKENGVKKETSVKKETPAKKGKKAIKGQTVETEEGEESEEGYRWWEEETQGDGTKKWETLQHNGVVFPPPYEPLPKHVKMRYDGVPVTLEPDAEEVAGFYGGMLHSTVNVENPTFNKNFFEDFQEILGKSGGAKDGNGNKIKIAKFEKCDFKPIFEHFDGERQAKKLLPNAEKKALKAEKDVVEAPFMYCLWDGRKQKVGNFRVEPPGLFRGRGEHPKTGRVKKRVDPEQITINIGKDATVPAPPQGHKWKEIKHDNEGTWLAMWQENINSAYKYVMLAANSDVKGKSDFAKFEKARDLKGHIDRIRNDYRKNLRAELMADRQLATAVYLIDQFALRAGNEKGEDEADTVGCCSLKFEHITLQPPNKVIFDFLGKDSIRFYDEVEVDVQVFKNLKIFKKSPKKAGDEIFDRLTTSALNKHLSNYMQGLTAKVFRTYNASWTMANLLKDLKATGSVAEKVKDYNDANRKVAILCNHKRTVAAGHEGQIEKMQDRINALVYQQYRIKQMMLDTDPKLKKKRGAEFFESPFDKDWTTAHHASLVEQERTKIEKKFEKDQAKLAADGEKALKPKELEERLEAADELKAKLAKELKSGKVEAEGKSPSVDKYDEQVAKLQTRIETMKLQSEDKENNKEVALGTSKINYIDPRLTVVFCAKAGLDISKFFSKTLREKFSWAIGQVNSNPDWEF